LLDVDAQAETARKLGSSELDLNQHSVWGSRAEIGSSRSSARCTTAHCDRRRRAPCGSRTSRCPPRDGVNSCWRPRRRPQVLPGPTADVGGRSGSSSTALGVRRAWCPARPR
jgi:hypothetical protein